jgi:hypothetical protein
MKLEFWESYTISEAKSAFNHGLINDLRIDGVLGEFHMIAVSKIDQKPIRTSRYEYKKYKSLDAIIKDYEYITSKKFKSFTFN